MKTRMMIAAAAMTGLLAGAGAYGATSSTAANPIPQQNLPPQVSGNQVKMPTSQAGTRAPQLADTAQPDRTATHPREARGGGTAATSSSAGPSKPGQSSILWRSGTSSS